MSHAILQFIHLENLLAEAVGTDALRVYVLEQTKTTTSNVLTWQEITIGLCVRAMVPGQRILSWTYQVDKFGFYTHEKAGHNDDSPEKARYEAAWQRAEALQTSLTSRLRQDEHTVYTGGLIEMSVSSFLPGTTRLIPLPTTSGAKREVA